MYRLFLTPAWFNGFDLLFEGISLVISLAIAGYSWRLYQLNKENKFGYFSFAFILVSLALSFKMITHGLLYYIPLRDAATQVLIPVVGRGSEGINYSNLFFRGGFLAYMITMLGAWLLIFFVSQKKTGRLKSYYEVSQIALFIYLVVLIAVVANFKYMVFFLTSAVILGMTVLNYYKNYLNKKRNTNAFLVMLAFLLILLSNIFFVFVFFSEIFYVFGQLLLLAGFLLLLYIYRKIVGK